LSSPWPMASADAAPATGEHDRRTWARILGLLRVHGLSGRLEVRNGRRTRALSVVGGAPVLFESDVPEDELATTLVDAGLVPGDRLHWLQGRLGDGESLQGALLMSGAIDQESLSRHQRDRLRIGIQAPLKWGSGSWTFRGAPGLQAGHIDPRLLPGVSSLEVLAHGIGTLIDLDTAMRAVGTAPVQPGPHQDALWDELELEGPLADAENMLGGKDLMALMSGLGESARELPALVWLLRAAGIARSDDQDHADTGLEALGRALCTAGMGDVDAGSAGMGGAGRGASAAASAAPPRAAAGPAPRAAAKPAPRAAAKPPAPEGSRTKRKAPTRPDPEATPRRAANRPTRPPASRRRSSASTGMSAPSRSLVPVSVVERMVETDHTERMDRDAYAFLDIQPDAPAETIRHASSRLGRRWRAAAKDGRLPAEARGLARALMDTVKRHRTLLLDADRRRAYDQEMGFVEGEAAGPATNGPLNAARALMDKGEHRAAVPHLERLRQENPSDGDVLADLGWATWHARKGDKAAQANAEEFLKLALTFDSRHALAAERLARISLAGADPAQARSRLRRVLRLTPDAAWAKQALDALPESEDESGSGLRFWRQKGGA
jgi:hypothetical protein